MHQRLRSGGRRARNRNRGNGDGRVLQTVRGVRQTGVEHRHPLPGLRPRVVGPGHAGPRSPARFGSAPVTQGGSGIPRRGAAVYRRNSAHPSGRPAGAAAFLVHHQRSGPVGPGGHPITTPGFDRCADSHRADLDQRACIAEHPRGRRGSAAAQRHRSRRLTGARLVSRGTRGEGARLRASLDAQALAVVTPSLADPTDSAVAPSQAIFPAPTACTMSVWEITPTRTPFSSTNSRLTSA